jgi:hypothetical protein
MANVIDLYTHIEKRILKKAKSLFQAMPAEYLFFNKKGQWVGYESQKKAIVWGHFDFYVSARMRITREYTPQEMKLYLKSMKKKPS